VQIVEQRNVAPQRLLVAIELDANAVDLRGHVVTLVGKAPHPRFDRGEPPRQQAAVLQGGWVEPTRPFENIRQQLAGRADVAVLRLGQEYGRRIRPPSVAPDRRRSQCVSDRKRRSRLDAADRGRVGRKRREIGGIAHPSLPPEPQLGMNLTDAIR
jgi:hypothetical protein